MTRDVCGVMISSSHMRVETHHSLWMAGIDHFVQPSGPYLDMGRNMGCRRFLNLPGHIGEGERHDEEWMLTIDSDVQFTPDDIDHLVAAANNHHAATGVYPIIGGAYMGVHKSSRDVIAYIWQNDRWVDGVRCRDLNTIPISLVQENNGPVEVDAIGTGFMLIHRSILLEMQKVHSEPWPWFIETAMPNEKKLWRKVAEKLGLRKSPDEVWFGEDLHFCFRAAALGHPILLHCGVKLVHYKDLGLAF